MNAVGGMIHGRRRPEYRYVKLNDEGDEEDCPSGELFLKYPGRYPKGYRYVGASSGGKLDERARALGELHSLCLLIHERIAGEQVVDWSPNGCILSPLSLSEEGVSFAVYAPLHEARGQVAGEIFLSRRSAFHPGMLEPRVQDLLQSFSSKLPSLTPLNEADPIGWSRTNSPDISPFAALPIGEEDDLDELTGDGVLRGNNATGGGPDNVATQVENQREYSKSDTTPAQLPRAGARGTISDLVREGENEAHGDSGGLPYASDPGMDPFSSHGYQGTRGGMSAMGEREAEDMAERIVKLGEPIDSVLGDSTVDDLTYPVVPSRRLAKEQTGDHAMPGVGFKFAEAKPSCRNCGVRTPKGEMRGDNCRKCDSEINRPSSTPGGGLREHTCAYCEKQFGDKSTNSHGMCPGCFREFEKQIRASESPKLKVKEQAGSEADELTPGTMGTTKYSTAVALIVRHTAGGAYEVLLGQAVADDDRNEMLASPGGGIDPEDGGDPLAAAKREAYEEAGVHVHPMHVLDHPEKKGVAFVVCEYLSGTPNANPEFSYLNWYPLADVEHNELVYPPNRQVLVQAQGYLQVREDGSQTPSVGTDKRVSGGEGAPSKHEPGNSSRKLDSEKPAEPPDPPPAIADPEGRKDPNVAGAEVDPPEPEKEKEKSET